MTEYLAQVAEANIEGLRQFVDAICPQGVDDCDFYHVRLDDRQELAVIITLDATNSSKLDWTVVMERIGRVIEEAEANDWVYESDQDNGRVVVTFHKKLIMY